MHHSSKDVALSVDGTLSDDESEESHSHKGFQSGSMRRKVREWARDVGQDGLVPSRDCDGKRRPQLTSHVHGASRGWAELGDRETWGCQDDKSTTCGRKKAGGNREAQMNSRVAT